MLTITYFIWLTKNTWHNIMAKNRNIRPTQSYEYYCYLFYSFYAHVKRADRWRLIFHHYADGQDECIIPLVVSKNLFQIRGISYYKRLDYDDIISTTGSIIFLKKALTAICERYPHYHITIDNINEHGLIYPVVKDIVTMQNPCAEIVLPRTYNDYFSSLSKHRRQNIRTSYNRLDYDDIIFSFKRYDASSPMSYSVWNQCEAVYEKRRGLYRNRKWIKILNRWLNAYHYILMRHPKRVSFILWADNVPMAYMAGLYSELQSTYYVPRLCINEKYAKYSPGIVLVNETVKYLITKGVQVLDLMSGGEPYKLAMGGSIHNNYQLHMNTDELLKHVHSA